MNDKMDNLGEDVGRRNLGIYVHIPFCIKKCNYCDFLSEPASDKVKKDYVDALLTEIDSYSNKNDEYTVSTIFFGGGTPSCIDVHDIQKIMQHIFSVFQIDRDHLEATIEANPGTVTKEKLQVYYNSGFNRLSFGLQSTDNKELIMLGRIHTYEQFIDNYQTAREVGFKNINIDLMSALPGQTVGTWENTLKQVIDLKPEHISAYSLIIEEGTKFYDIYKEGAESFTELPDEDTDREIYHLTKKMLESAGYSRYEISNYAKPGYECMHNCAYWIGSEYLGVGLGASSLLNGARFSNLHTLGRYIQLCNEYKYNRIVTKNNVEKKSLKMHLSDDQIGLRQDFEQLAVKQRMEEFMFLGLRMCEGITKSAFFQRFHVEIDSIYGPTLQELMKKNLIIISGDRIQLTEYGIDVSNTVLSVFLLN